jgi:hypothetical protein
MAQHKLNVDLDAPLDTLAWRGTGAFDDMKVEVGEQGAGPDYPSSGIRAMAFGA